MKPNLNRSNHEPSGESTNDLIEEEKITPNDSNKADMFDVCIGKRFNKNIEVLDSNSDSESVFYGCDEVLDDLQIEESADTNVVRQRISARSTKGKPPDRFTNEVNILGAIKTPDPIHFKEAIGCEQNAFWKRAMNEEMQSLEKNGTWQLTDLPADKKAIGSKWVYKSKEGSKGEIVYKARLVAQGFLQRHGMDYDETFAPVVRQTTLRTLLAVAGHRKMHVLHLDAKTAFLNSELEETVYMRQPMGFVKEGKEHQVCELKKAIYGLKQSARSWNQTISNLLLGNGYHQSDVDPCLFKKLDDEFWIYILIYVDDLLVISKSQKHIDDAECLLKSKFEMKNLGPVRNYVGLEVHRDTAGNFSISQSAYINKVIQEMGLKDAKTSKIPMHVSYGKSSDETNYLTDNEKYQKYIGCFLYISVNSRPDIAASTSILASKVSQPSTEDWNELKRVARYLKGSSSLKLCLNQQGVEEKLMGYADANWAEDRKERKSNSGYIFKVFGRTVSWCCQ